MTRHAVRRRRKQAKSEILRGLKTYVDLLSEFAENGTALKPFARDMMGAATTALRKLEAFESREVAIPRLQPALQAWLRVSERGRAKLSPEILELIRESEQLGITFERRPPSTLMTFVRGVRDLAVDYWLVALVSAIVAVTVFKLAFSGSLWLGVVAVAVAFFAGACALGSVVWKFSPEFRRAARRFQPGTVKRVSTPVSREKGVSRGDRPTVH